MNEELASRMQQLENNLLKMTHWVCIKAYTKKGGDLIERLYWDQMSFDMRCKWGWYFNYRKALLQVQHPKAEVEMYWGHELSNTLQTMQRALAAKKGQITKTENEIDRMKQAIEKARKNWMKIFPIEDDTHYKQALMKLAKLNTKRLRLIDELKEFESKQ